MFFGLRLPGPFRVGWSPDGRTSVGVTAGPLSVSRNVGHVNRRQREIVIEGVDLLDGIADMLDHGWKVQGLGEGWALLGKGFRAVELERTVGGVLVRRVTSRRKVLAWLVVAAAVVVVFAVAGCGPKDEPATVDAVHPGSYCQQAGAQAQTEKGRPMVCATTEADDKLRWRSR